MNVTYNGISTNSLGLIARVSNFPILPQPKTLLIESDYIDGVYDLSSYNKDGRQYFNERSIDIELGLPTNSFPDKMELSRKVAQWVLQGTTGYKELILEEAPDRIWMAKLNSQLLLENITFSKGKVTVPFRCKPFAYGTQQTINGTFDLNPSSIILDGDISVPINLNFMMNYGYEVFIQINEIDFLWFDSINGKVEVNSEAGYVKINDEYTTRYAKGRFPVLTPGDNFVSVLGAVGDVSYSFSPVYAM